MSSGIEIAGSLNPTKECQDRVRVFSVGGNCPAIRATDYKDPPKILLEIRYEEQCCGNCKWHEHENIDDGWVCVNPDSEYLADWTEYSDKCDMWEER